MKHWVLFILLCLTAPSSFAANWQLDSSNSNLNFFSIKKSTIGENLSFSRFEGNLNDKGEFELSISLTSVKTGISIRDERMKKLLFDVTNFPKAIITAKVQQSHINNLSIGMHEKLSVPMKLQLHGHVSTLTANVTVAKLSDKTFLLTSVQPIIVNAQDFKLDAGIEKLMKIAGLPSIGEAVPVSFTLLFKKK
ncbi:YceI family protein [Parashewanella curva]|uniref:YceI family protein n=1 Tax=Parashewanella curva TaxID=2338552 RepID=A0A3L8PU97_9GAMM|nr:YceI family protein [Parashewanella curva]RLV58886.1 YceI family protein [Parashewanella curva]